MSETIKNTFFSSKTLTLEAGASRPLNVTGNYFLCTAADGPFDISFDDGEVQHSELGLGFEFNSGDMFTKVTIVNPVRVDSPALTLTVWACRGKVIDNRLNNTYNRPVIVANKEPIEVAVTGTATVHVTNEATDPVPVTVENTTPLAVTISGLLDSLKYLTCPLLAVPVDLAGPSSRGEAANLPGNYAGLRRKSVLISVGRNDDFLLKNSAGQEIARFGDTDNAASVLTIELQLSEPLTLNNVSDLGDMDESSACEIYYNPGPLA